MSSVRIPKPEDWHKQSIKKISVSVLENKCLFLQILCSTWDNYDSLVTPSVKYTHFLILPFTSVLWHLQQKCNQLHFASRVAYRNPSSITVLSRTARSEIGWLGKVTGEDSNNLRNGQDEGMNRRASGFRTQKTKQNQ